jgi:nucleoside-diphosphate-sugar epimerase
VEQQTDLITGASGFIGGHLARRLVQLSRSDQSGPKRKVRVLCRKGSEKKLPRDIVDSLEISFGDLRDRDSLIQATQNVSRVFHCAGHVSDWGTTSHFFDMNVQGTRWLLEGAQQSADRAPFHRFVHLSSIAAFGTPAPKFFDDTSPYGKSDDLYSRTKVEGERAVFQFHQDTGLPVTVLRPAVVYGKEGTWLEEPLKMIQQGKMFLLGGGVGTCHPCYIENLLDAIVLAADHPGAVAQGYIVGDGDSISFKDYFNAVAALAGKGPIRKSIPLPVARMLATGCELAAKFTKSSSRPLLTHAALGMVTTQSQMSIDKIRKDLAFQPRYTFQEAMKELKSSLIGPD